MLGEPHVRFYAGAPILDSGGVLLGSVCVIDTKPHALSSRRLLALARLAEVAAAGMENRLSFERPRRPDASADLDDLLLTMVASRPKSDRERGDGR